MSEQRVVVLSRQGAASLLPADREQLQRLSDVSYHALPDVPGPSRAMELLDGATVLAATNAVLPVLDEPTLGMLPQLHTVVLYATGYDHLDTRLLTRHGVTLSVLPDYATVAVAEHALGLLLGLSTRLHLAHDRSRRLAADDVSLRGVELAGRTLAVIGLGRIGRRVAALAHGIGMDVVGVDVDPLACARASASGLRVLGLRAALGSADAVAVCASHTFGGPPVLGPAELHALRPGALVVNVARPALVDTAAAAASLRAGRLRGYAVDDVVLDPARDADLLQQGRVLQTGHSAWWRDEVLDRGRRMWGQALLDAVRGRPRDVVTTIDLTGSRADGLGLRDPDVAIEGVG